MLSQNYKFSTDQMRAAHRARYVDDKNIRGICTRCGKTKRLVRHHPDYLDCYLVEYLCYRCHRLEHPKGIRYAPLPREATARRMAILLGKYGPRIAALFANFYDFPSLRAVDLAKKAGLHRESVRQFLIQLHGTCKRKVIMKEKSRPLPVQIPLDYIKILGIDNSHLSRVNRGLRHLSQDLSDKLLSHARDNKDSRLAGLTWLDLRPQDAPSQKWLQYG